jgi:hypothetical protein
VSVYFRPAATAFSCGYCFTGSLGPFAAPTGREFAGSLGFSSAGVPEPAAVGAVVGGTTPASCNTEIFPSVTIVSPVAFANFFGALGRSTSV